MWTEEKVPMVGQHLLGLEMSGNYYRYGKKVPSGAVCVKTKFYRSIFTNFSATLF